jgi:hypothetical protein
MQGEVRIEKARQIGYNAIDPIGRERLRIRATEQV